MAQSKLTIGCACVWVSVSCVKGHCGDQLKLYSNFLRRHNYISHDDRCDNDDDQHHHHRLLHQHYSHSCLTPSAARLVILVLQHVCGFYSYPFRNFIPIINLVDLGLFLKEICNSWAVSREVDTFMYRLDCEMRHFQPG